MAAPAMGGALALSSPLRAPSVTVRLPGAGQTPTGERGGFWMGKPVDAFGDDPVGTGERRRLARFAETVHAVTDAADTFANNFTASEHRRFARLGLIGFKFLGGFEGRINLCVKPTALMIKMNRPDKQQHERNHDNPHWSRRTRHDRFAGRIGATGLIGFVTHRFVEKTGVKGGYNSGPLAWWG